METLSSPVGVEFFTVFKSYYVVWKLIFLSIDTEKEYEFKSYYVVWKLDGIPHTLAPSAV